MAGPPKTKVSKRKLDNTVLVKNPKASKQDHNTSELEALKLELNLMKDKYEALVIENKEKIKKNYALHSEQLFEFQMYSEMCHYYMGSVSSLYG